MLDLALTLTIYTLLLLLLRRLAAAAREKGEL